MARYIINLGGTASDGERTYKTKSSGCKVIEATEENLNDLKKLHPSLAYAAAGDRAVLRGTTQELVSDE